jgi:HlyD family type I secretion membrane fusion protein
MTDLVPAGGMLPNVPPSRWRALLARARRFESFFFSPADDYFSDPELGFMSARPLIGRGKIVIGVFLLGFCGWAALAPLDSAIMAPGVIIVESHRKTIQHLEGGIVRAIDVNDGDKVKNGQVLMRLDDTQARASLNLLLSENDALAAQEARLEAQRDGAGTITFPKSLTSRTADASAVQAVRGEENTFNAQRDTLNKQIDILTQRNKQNARIAAGIQSELDSIEQQKALIDQETDSVQGLYNKGLSTLPRLLQLQRQAADLDGQRGQLIEKIAQAQLNSGENDLQIASLRNQMLSDTVKDLRDVQTKRFDLLDKIRAAQDVLTRLTIVAPVAGRVVGLTVHTIGAVVRPSETIMEIVPDKDALEVEARVRPQDADGVYAGMTAKVNLSAYESRRLPVINGTVETISADSLTDQRTGRPYFSATISVDRSQLKDYPDVHIIPGMPVSVAINTGTRTAFDYLVEPLTDVLNRGMREK